MTILRIPTHQVALRLCTHQINTQIQVQINQSIHQVLYIHSLLYKPITQVLQKVTVYKDRRNVTQPNNYRDRITSG